MFQGFLFALHRIAANPEKYQEPLRQEACEAIARHGWTKEAMDNLPKLDSIMRESQRLTPFNSGESTTITNNMNADLTDLQCS